VKSEKVVQRMQLLSFRCCKLRMATTMRDLYISHISMFHEVFLDVEPLPDEYACHVSHLIDYIETCKSLGFEFVSIDEILTKSSQDSIYKKCVITFDDGFASTLTVVAPLLANMKVPFTVYVTTSYIGKHNYLSEKQLKALAENPFCTIGMHGDRHIMFRYETDSALEEDFCQCKKRLAAIINEEPRHYAFPYGSVLACSKRNVRVIKSLGVSSIALTSALKLTQKDLRRPFHLPRLNIPGYYNGSMRRVFRGLPIGEKI